jgi:hypothetical protein
MWYSGVVPTRRLIIYGDLNVDYLKSNTSFNQLKDLPTSYTLANIVNFPSNSVIYYRDDAEIFFYTYNASKSFMLKLETKQLFIQKRQLQY